MKKALIAAGVLVVALVAVAWWQGWIKFEKTKTDDGQTHLGVGIDTGKFKQDRDKLKKASADRTKAMKEKLAKLEEEAKTATGDAKKKLQEKIHALTERHKKIESKTTALEGAPEDKFEELKKDLDSALQDADKDEDK